MHPSPTPSPDDPSDPPTAEGPDHVVHFYQSESGLSNVVASFLAEGAREGQPLLVIASPERRDRFTEQLESRGIDCRLALRSGRLTFIDARELLARFMVGPLPDSGRFHAAVGEELRRILPSDGRSRARAYGEMVDILSRDGNPDGALRVEELWDELSGSYRFTRLCGYAMSLFSREADGRRFHEVCARHARVIPGESFPMGADAAFRLREISRLQQRALALEAEMERRKGIERELMRAKEEAERADRAKTEFLQVMSHELRTPLNAIIGYRELLDLELGGPLTPKQRTYLGRIDAGARQLLGLIEQILSLSRIEAGAQRPRPERVDAGALAAEAAEIVEAAALQKGLEFRVVEPPEPVTCRTDPGMLRQILLNLLSNAVKFTTEGRVELRVHDGQEGVYFEVRDTGEGIDEADLDRIFEPFVQVEASPGVLQGTGLGLPVSRELAGLLGGRLTVESVKGVGSVFHLRIPRGLLPRRRAAEVA